MGQRLVIADPETGEERPEGEIWVSGPSVARGYWENPEATGRDFNAFLPSGEGPFLRTGDLGFLSGGELYVTGRLKDLIVVDGRNFHPQDIEAAAGEAHPAIRRDRVAAFGVADEDGEGAMVVAEWVRDADADLKEVTRAVLRAVSREHDLTLRAVHLVPSGGLPRTSSGKVARSAAKARYGDVRG
jgi:acyl-CoA synthetase (AMP-forming)/AMP-acid ligase II